MKCRVCDDTKLTQVLNLGDQPWCNDFLHAEEVGQERFYPLHLVYCEQCTTAQLDFTVPKETMFGDHTYLSGITKSLSDHFQTIAKQVDVRFFANKPRKSVLDIGSNDGTQLKHFQSLGWDVLGVESSKTTAELALNAGVPTVNEFYNDELAARLNRKFHVINAAGVFFHLEELHSVTQGINRSLHKDGVFVIQFLYMPSILSNRAFDQIYHEHLLYYSIYNLSILLKRHQLEIFDAYLAPIHGGSMIAFCGHPGRRRVTKRLREIIQNEEQNKVNDIRTYFRFADDVARMKGDNLNYLEQKRQQGKSVFGMGAPVKGNTLINYFGIKPKQIPYLIERNPLRRGRFAPGSHIPIKIEDEFQEIPDVYYVLAWNFKTEILKRYQHLNAQGVEFYFPIDVQGV